MQDAHRDVPGRRTPGDGPAAGASDDRVGAGPPAPRRGRPTPWRALVGALGVAVLVLVPGAVATAEPDRDFDAELRVARQAESDAGDQVAQLESRLAEVRDQAELAWVDVERAAEDYTEALVSLDAATRLAEWSTSELASSQEGLQLAGRALVSLALQSMRTGGSAEQLRAFLEADGVRDLVEYTELLDVLGTRAEQAVQEYATARAAAEAAEARAAAAVADREAAMARADAALAAAQDSQREAEEVVAGLLGERESLLARLAAARNTTIDIERDRQDALDDERRGDGSDDGGSGSDGPGADGPGSDEPGDGGSGGNGPGGGDSGDDGSGTGGPGGSGPSPSPSPGSSPGPSPSPTPSPTPSPSPTTSPSPSPSPSPTPGRQDPYGLGKGTSRGSAAAGQKAVEWAQEQLGVPYQFGGTGNPGFDCSGLTMRAWQHAGVALNRTSRDQYKQVLKIERSSVRPGDLLFWGDDPGNNDPDSITHVAMYIGGNKVIEAPRPGLDVRIVELSGWRLDRIMPFAGRP